MRFGKCRGCFGSRSKSLPGCVQVAASHGFGCLAKRFGHLGHVLGKTLRTAQKQTEECQNHRGSNVSEADRKKFPHVPVDFTKPTKLESITTSRRGRQTKPKKILLRMVTQEDAEGPLHDPSEFVTEGYLYLFGSVENARSTSELRTRLTERIAGYTTIASGKGVPVERVYEIRFERQQMRFIERDTFDDRKILIHVTRAS